MWHQKLTREEVLETKLEIMEIYGYPWKQNIPVRNSKDNKTISLIT